VSAGPAAPLLLRWWIVDSRAWSADGGVGQWRFWYY